MRHKFIVAILVAVIGAVACTKSSNAPSQTTTTTAPPTTTSTTTSVATTTLPATFTVSGRVTSEKDGSNLPFPDIEIIQGANIGRRFQGDSNGVYTMPGLSPGAFVMRVWAAGYLVKDVLVTVTTANLTVNVQLTPVPPSTTTTPALKANFTWSPNPCTISPGPVTNCTVDGSSSTGFRSGVITTFHWSYGGKDVFGQTSISLSVQCTDLIGTGPSVSVSVRLTVTDEFGNVDSLDQGVPFTKLGGVCPP